MSSCGPRVVETRPACGSPVRPYPTSTGNTRQPTPTGLYDLVRRKFSRRAKDEAVLRAATGAGPESAEVLGLADALARATEADPDFDRQLRLEWVNITSGQHADNDGVTNQITGNVSGNVVQARDIQGGISF